MSEMTHAVEARQAGAHYELAVALANRGRMAEALESFDRTLQLQPQHGDARRDRAMLLALWGRPREAARELESLAAGTSGDVRINYARAVASFFSGDLAGARRELEAVLAEAPGMPLAQFNLGQIELLEGRLGRGFELYESRWQSPTQQAQRRAFTQPQWNGSQDLRGARLLLHCEQGLGDSIQFCRYLPLLARRARHVVFETQPSLVSLMRRSLPGTIEVIARGSALPAFDLHCPLLSLPNACATTLETIPAPAAYLAPDAARVDAWRARLRTDAVLRVGFAWSGNPAHAQDHARNLDPAALGGLIEQAHERLGQGVEFLAVQDSVRACHADALAALPELRFFGDAIADFHDTAALVALCDLVVCVDTAPAHLAGALGRPLWIALPYVPDWRWMLERADSPWYPSARLFRQAALGDWSAVLARLRSAFGAWLDGFGAHKGRPAS